MCTSAGTVCHEVPMCCTFDSENGYSQRIKETWLGGCPHLSAIPTTSPSFGSAPFRTAPYELFLCCIATASLIVSAGQTSQHILSSTAIALG